MSNPWNGKGVLEVFWWNCWNGNYPFDWYTYIAKLAPRIAAMGFDGIWTPRPCKDAVAHSNGLEVYPDIVLDHCSGGDPDPSSPFEQTQHGSTSFHPTGFAGLD